VKKSVSCYISHFVLSVKCHMTLCVLLYDVDQKVLHLINS